MVVKNAVKKFKSKTVRHSTGFEKYRVQGGLRSYKILFIECHLYCVLNMAENRSALSQSSILNCAIMSQGKAGVFQPPCM